MIKTIRAALAAALLAGGLTACGGGDSADAPTSDTPADARNGEYLVFAANGTRHTLSINFDTLRYTLTDTVGNKDHGSLNAPVAPAQEWTVDSPSVVVGHAASFRVLPDTIVGALPFAVPFSAPVDYAVYPFVATRAAVRTPNQLDGAYDRAGIEYLPSGARQSSISQIEIIGGGTEMRHCNHMTIFRIEDCPAASVVRSDIVADAVPGLWQVREPGNGTLRGHFAVADIDGQKVYLLAGVSPADGSHLLRIGVPATTAYDDSPFTSSGWSTNGTRDTTTATTTKQDLSLSAQSSTAFLNLTRLGPYPGGPAGIHSTKEADGQAYFAMRSKRLELLIGARDSAQAGLLHLGIVD